MFKKILGFVAAACLMTLTSFSHATVITGDTVRVTHYYPDASSVYSILGTAVVPTATISYGNIYDVVISGSSLTVDVHCGPGCTWGSTPFNGPVLEDLTNASFTNASIGATSNYAGFDASRLSFDANHIYMNFARLDANGFLAVDFGGNAVPEPASLALFGLALAGLVTARRRKS